MTMQKHPFLNDMADAFKRGGIERAYNFPGFHSHELYAALSGDITSTNEKVAYELAWGSSQAGCKSLVTFKNVGLNDAADPFINSYLTGVGAGLVLVVFDDIELEGSQCILDSRHYANFYGGLWIEPYSYESALVLAEAAPQLSYIFNLPVVMRLTNVSVGFESRSKVTYSAEEICGLAKALIGDMRVEVEPVVHPINGEMQRNVVSSKNIKIQEFVNELHKFINPANHCKKVAIGNESRDADSFIATIPVPDIDTSLIDSVSEVGDPVVSNALKLKAAKVKFQSSAIGYNHKNAENYIRTKRYERIFKLLKPKYTYITGDLGEYTKDTLNTLTHCLCFGSSVSVAAGMTLTGSSALAITGDASYYHSAKNAWREALDRGLQPKLVLLDNGGSQGTGGQPIPGEIEGSINVLSVDYDSISDEELENVVNRFVSSPEAMILKVNHKV